MESVGDRGGAWGVCDTIILEEVEVEGGENIK